MQGDQDAAKASQLGPGFNSFGVLHTLHRRDDECWAVCFNAQLEYWNRMPLPSFPQILAGRAAVCYDGMRTGAYLV